MCSLALLFASCTDDGLGEPVGQGTSFLQVLPMTPSYYDVQPMTRADYLPTGYVPYASLHSATSPVYANIGVFMVPERANPTGDYIYQDVDENGRGLTTWSSTIAVQEGTTYYMYGFMPRMAAERASITPLSGDDYSTGAVISLTNFKTLTPADVCVISGARKATTEEATQRQALSDVKLGKFDYTGGAEGDNSMFVLLKHIYSGFHFRAIIDPEYHKLRTIKFTKVELIADSIAESIDLNITITANNNGTDPVTNITYSPNSSAVSENSIQLFPWDGSVPEYELKEYEPDKFLACFAPASCTSFIVQTTYNVYDRFGNKIREGCVARNRINKTLVPQLDVIEAGEVYTFTCLVKPTYLYVLSEPDLDNPKIELTLD